MKFAQKCDTFSLPFSALKEGYDSDSSIIVRRSPGAQTPIEAKSDYTRIQRGGDVPLYGLRMSAPEKPKGE